MKDVTFGDQVLNIDGVPALIQAGTLHYFRLPHPDLWRPVLERMRMAGLNAVMIPFPWAYHSPAAGLYDFTGPRNLLRLLDEVERLGLWLIVHLGPWIGARLDAGGVPMWCRRIPGFVPHCESDVPAGPSFVFLRYVREWWERLLPYFLERSNLLLFMLDPGLCAAGPLPRYVMPLAELARELGMDVPCVAPVLPTLTGKVSTPSDAAIALLPLVRVDGAHGATSIASASFVGVADVSTDLEVNWNSDSREQMMRSLGMEHPREAMAGVLGSGVGIYTLSPIHTSMTWGYWRTTPHCTLYGVGSPIQEGEIASSSYFAMRRLIFSAETLGQAFTTKQTGHMVYASNAQYLKAARTSASATATFLSSAQGGAGETRVSLALGDEMLTTEPVSLPDGAVRVLPLNWRIAGGKLLTTTLEPILCMLVAGRRLLVLANESGGNLLFSDDFRSRHARGPVRTQRSSSGLTVRFEASRVISLLLDGPEGPLQVLALALHFAARVWPLDDGWRVTPAYPAAWNPTPEDPARGLLIGPEFVRPRSDGGYDYLVGQKGFGYRWGPWRGSDPHTWLAPVTWGTPHPVSLPELAWDTPRPGAPEVLPHYDDTSWRYVAHRAPLAVTVHDVNAGFVWYRGRFSGAASSVTLRCRHACDVFLNGTHIAALNAVLHPADAVPKTLPLPAHLLRSQNVLVILVECAGFEGTWDTAAEARGLLSCALDSGDPVSWRIRGGLSGEQSVQGFPGFADWALVPDDGTPDITWHRTVFDLSLPDNVEVPIFLYLERTPTKAYVFLNGQLIGHYWDGHGPQHRFWLPEGLLHRQGENELMVLQWTRGAAPQLGVTRLETGSVMQWH